MDPIHHMLIWDYCPSQLIPICFYDGALTWCICVDYCPSHLISWICFYDGALAWCMHMGLLFFASYFNLFLWWSVGMVHVHGIIVLHILSQFVSMVEPWHGAGYNFSFRWCFSIFFDFVISCVYVRNDFNFLQSFSPAKQIYLLVAHKKNESARF